MIRLVTLVLCFLLAASAVAAEGGDSAPSGTGTSEKITLEIENEPLIPALTRLFEMVGVSYVFDPEISEEPEDYNKKVTAKLKNVTFEQALDSLLSGPDLTWRKENGVIVIEPRLAQIVKQQMQQALSGIGGPKPTPTPVMPVQPAAETATREPYPILQRQIIPPMSIREALELIQPGWTFKGDLGDTLIPGAMFSQISRSAAARILLIAAGLVPPDEGMEIVKHGQLSLSDYAASESFYLGPGGIVIVGTSTKAPDGEQPYAVFFERTPTDLALSSLLSMARVAHVVATPPGDRQDLTVRLYDVTLDEALNNIVPTLGLKYRKQGPKAKPTYIIEPTSQKTVSHISAQNSNHQTEYSRGRVAFQRQVTRKSEEPEQPDYLHT